MTEAMTLPTNPLDGFAAAEPDQPAAGVAGTAIGDLVASYPGVEAVLDDFGFDTCCTVEFTPLELAEKAAIDPEPLVEALRQVVGA